MEWKLIRIAFWKLFWTTDSLFIQVLTFIYLQFFYVWIVRYYDVRIHLRTFTDLYISCVCLYILCILVQGVPKGADTFQSLIIIKLDNLRIFFHITKVSIKCHFFNNLGKTVNLSFIVLTSVNSLCSIYFPKDKKKSVSTKFIKFI